MMTMPEESSPQKNMLPKSMPRKVLVGEAVWEDHHIGSTPEELREGQVKFVSVTQGGGLVNLAWKLSAMPSWQEVPHLLNLPGSCAAWGALSEAVSLYESPRATKASGIVRLLELTPWEHQTTCCCTE